MQPTNRGIPINSIWRMPLRPTKIQSRPTQQDGGEKGLFQPFFSAAQRPERQAYDEKHIGQIQDVIQVVKNDPSVRNTEGQQGKRSDRYPGFSGKTRLTGHEQETQRINGLDGDRTKNVHQRPLPGQKKEKGEYRGQVQQPHLGGIVIIGRKQILLPGKNIAAVQEIRHIAVQNVSCHIHIHVQCQQNDKPKKEPMTLFSKCPQT